MTINFNGNGRKFHKEVLAVLDFTRKLINTLESNSSTKQFVSMSQHMPKLEILTCDTNEWYICHLDLLKFTIDEVSKKKMKKNEAIYNLRIVEDSVQHELNSVETQIHNEFVSARAYVQKIIDSLATCNVNTNLQKKIGIYAKTMPNFNFLVGDRIITCVRQVCTGEIGISEAIKQLQEVERKIDSELTRMNS